MTGASRFVSSLAALLAGAMLVVVVFAFSARTAAWVAFALAAAVLMIMLAAFAMRGRGPLMRTLDVVMMIVAAWATMAARVFGGAHLIRWLGVADGAAIAGLGCAGLLVHEFLRARAMERACASVLAEGQRARAEGPRARAQGAPAPVVIRRGAEPRAGAPDDRRPIADQLQEAGR